MTIPYPKIPPDILSIGPFHLRWYGVMYLVGYFVGYQLVLARIRRGIGVLTQKELDALLPYLVIGMLIGARLTYVFVYDFPAYRAHPLNAFAIWTGGLSFHGAIVGMSIAIVLFAWRHKLPVLAITDLPPDAADIAADSDASGISSMASFTDGRAMCRGRWFFRRIRCTYPDILHNYMKRSLKEFCSRWFCGLWIGLRTSKGGTGTVS